uniref:Uncharacterized protein n=1 Tax=Rhodnius prolixus TaxID=13249 RepID=T1HT11_RHOPR
MLTHIGYLRTWVGTYEIIEDSLLDNGREYFINFVTVYRKQNYYCAKERDDEGSLCSWCDMSLPENTHHFLAECPNLKNRNYVYRFPELILFATYASSLPPLQ